MIFATAVDWKLSFAGRRGDLYGAATDPWNVVPITFWGVAAVQVRGIARGWNHPQRRKSLDAGHAVLA